MLPSVNDFAVALGPHLRTLYSAYHHTRRSPSCSVRRLMRKSSTWLQTSL
jgi:hypothetical protein